MQAMRQGPYVAMVIDCWAASIANCKGRSQPCPAPLLWAGHLTSCNVETAAPDNLSKQLLVSSSLALLLPSSCTTH